MGWDNPTPCVASGLCCSLDLPRTDIHDCLCQHHSQAVEMGTASRALAHMGYTGSRVVQPYVEDERARRDCSMIVDDRIQGSGNKEQARVA